MQKAHAKADVMNPFIGPRAFTQDPQHQRLFFGRDRETDEIASLIFSHQLVLVYAQSGTGKTSIFNAKVIPKLRENGFDVLPVARVGEAGSPVSTDSSSDFNVSSTSNAYLLNAFHTLIPTIDRPSISDSTLSSFLNNALPAKRNNRGKLMPQVIIFDQFEEIFNFYPNERWQEQRQEFFEQIGEALENNSLLRIVFIIREDYLAQLDPFVHLLPERLRPRFRLERLRRDAARKAIKGPFEISGRTIDDNVIEKLLDNLLNIQIETSFGKLREAKGEFIEPIHLQVVCQKLWQIPLHGSNISLNDLQIIGNVDSALEDFYEDAIHRASEGSAPKAAKPHDGKIYEGDIRIWCEKKLITSTGTRSIVHRGPRLTGGIPNAVIDSLENNYLIRGEWKPGGKWYELTHDRLIKPVLDSNKKWKNKLQTELKRNKKARSRTLIISIGAFVAFYAILLLSILSPTTSVNQDQDVINVAVNPNTNMVYVTATNGTNRVVSIINGTTNNLVGHILVDYGERSAIAVNPNTNTVYAARPLDNTISVINGTTNKEVGHILVENRSISAIAVNRNTNMIYAASDLKNTISVINGTTNEVVGHIEINGHSGDIAIDPISNRIYAGKVSRNEPVAVINGSRNVIVDHIGDGYITKSIVNPNTHLIYAASYIENTISIINGTTGEVVRHILVDYGERSAIAVNPNTNMVYVTATNGTNRVVSIINGITGEVMDQIRVDG